MARRKLGKGQATRRERGRAHRKAATTTPATVRKAPPLHIDAYAVVFGVSTTQSGSRSDLARVASLRNKIRGNFIWLRQGKTAYIIRDQRVVKRVASLFAPQTELGKLQAQLGSRQARIGKEQARVGEEGEPAAGSQRALPANRQYDLASEQVRLAEQQSRLGEEQAKVVAEAEVKLEALVSDAMKKGIAAADKPR